MTKILLVEDNEMNLDMLSRRLQKKGTQCAQARIEPIQSCVLAIEVCLARSAFRLQLQQVCFES